jgi:endonuclease G, mitochondrial
VLEQDLADVPLEFVVDASWRQHMISIADLEQALGQLRFPDSVRDADQSGTDTGEAVRESAGIEMVGRAAAASGSGSTAPPSAPVEKRKRRT